jgi:hypothetical protein
MRQPQNCCFLFISQSHKVHKAVVIRQKLSFCSLWLCGKPLLSETQSSDLKNAKRNDTLDIQFRLDIPFYHIIFEK